MEIIVKKDIFDELQAKGVCRSKEESEKFLNIVITEIAKNIETNKIKLAGFGTFFCTQKKDAELLDNSIIFDKITQNLADMNRERSTQAWEVLINYIKNMIVKGYEVQIMDFTSFRIEERKARLGRSPKTGHRVITSNKKLLKFDPDKKFLELCKIPIEFEPEAEVQKQIEKSRSGNIVLLVPTRDFFIKTVEYHFEKAGWKINTCHNVEDAQKFLRTAKPQLLIIDVLVDKHQEICEFIKCNRETNLIPLVLLYPKDMDIKKTDNFRVCGDEHIIQPFEIKQLVHIIESLLWRISEESTILKHEVVFQFPTTDENIERASELCGKLFALSGLSEEEQITFNAAFREALANAAQHGNKHRRDRMLEVLYLLDREKITASIADSGTGFDWQNYIKTNQANDAVGRARQSQKEGRMGGLGIMLMSRCVDKIEYNEIGNIVTLSKIVKPAVKAQ